MFLRILLYGLLLLHMATMPMDNDAPESGLVIKKITGRVVSAKPEDFFSPAVKQIVSMPEKTAALQALYPIAFGKTAQGDTVPVDPSAQYVYAHLVESQLPLLAMRAISTAAQNRFFPAQVALVRQQPKSLMELSVLESIVQGQTLSGGHQLYHLPSIKMYADLMRVEHPETAVWFDTLRNDLECQLAVSRPNAISHPTMSQPDTTSTSVNPVHAIIDSTTNQSSVQAPVDALSEVIQKIESSPSPSPVLVKKSSPKPNATAGDLADALAMIEQQQSSGKQISQAASPSAAPQPIKEEVPVLKKQPNNVPQDFSQSLAVIAAENFDQSDAVSKQAVIKTVFESDVHVCDPVLLQKALRRLMPLTAGNQQRADRLARLVYYVIPDDHRAPAILAQASDNEVRHMARTIITSPQTADAQVVTWAGHLLARGLSFDHDVSARVERAALDSACAQDAIKLLCRQKISNKKSLLSLLSGRVAYDQELLQAAVNFWDDAAAEQKKMLAQKMLSCSDTGSVTIPSLAAVYAVRDDHKKCFAALEAILRHEQNTADVHAALKILEQEKGMLQRKDCRSVAKSLALAVCQTYNDARHDQKDFVQWLITQVLNTAVTDQDDLATQRCLLKTYTKLNCTAQKILNQSLRVLNKSSSVDISVLNQIKLIVPQLSTEIIQQDAFAAITALARQSKLTSDMTQRELILEVAESISDQFPLEDADLDDQDLSCMKEMLNDIASGTAKAPLYEAASCGLEASPEQSIDTAIASMERLKTLLHLEKNPKKNSELRTTVALDLGSLYYRKSVEPGVSTQEKNELQQKVLNGLSSYVNPLLQGHVIEKSKANALYSWAAVAYRADRSFKNDMATKLGVNAAQLGLMIIRALEMAHPHLAQTVQPECNNLLQEIRTNKKMPPAQNIVTKFMQMSAPSLPLEEASRFAQQAIEGERLYSQAIALLNTVVPDPVKPAGSLAGQQASGKRKEAINGAGLHSAAVGLQSKVDTESMFEVALQQLEQSAALDHAPAARRLVTMYLQDSRLTDIPDSKNKAKRHLESLINKGDQRLLLLYGTVLQDEGNFDEAIKLYTKAVPAPDEKAVVDCMIGEAYIKWAESVQGDHLKKIYKHKAWEYLKQLDTPKAKIMRLAIAYDQEIKDQNSYVLEQFFSVLGDIDTGDVDFDYLEKILEKTALVGRIQQLENSSGACYVLGRYHMLRAHKQSKNPEEILINLVHAKNYYEQAVRLGERDAHHPLCAIKIQLAEYHKNHAEVADELSMDMLAWYANGDCKNIVQNLCNCIASFKVSSDQAAHDQIDELATSVSSMLACIDSSNPNDASDSLNKRMQLLVLQAELITYYREKKNVPAAQALCKDVAQDIVEWLQSDISQPWADAQYFNKITQFFTLWHSVMQDADNAVKIYDKLIPFKPDMQAARDNVLDLQGTLRTLWENVPQKDVSSKGLKLVVLKNDKQEMTGYRLMQDPDQKK